MAASGVDLTSAGKYSSASGKRGSARLTQFQGMCRRSRQLQDLGFAAAYKQKNSDGRAGFKNVWMHEPRNIPWWTPCSGASIHSRTHLQLGKAATCGARENSKAGRNQCLCRDAREGAMCPQLRLLHAQAHERWLSQLIRSSYCRYEDAAPAGAGAFR